MVFWVPLIAVVLLAGVGTHASDGSRVLAEYGYGYGEVPMGVPDTLLTFSVTSVLAGVTLADVTGTTVGDDLCGAAVATFYEVYGGAAMVTCENEFSASSRRSLLQPGVSATQTITADSEAYPYDELEDSFAEFIKALPAAFEEESGDWPFPFAAEDATVKGITVAYSEEDGESLVADVAVADNGTFVITVTETVEGEVIVTVYPKDADGEDVPSGVYGVQAAPAGVAVTAEASAFEAV